MVTHMKTTVEIPDALLDAARDMAKKEKTTLRSLIEEGLRLALARRRGANEFHVRDAAVDGTGLHPGLGEGDWGDLRNRIYEGRGG